MRKIILSFFSLILLGVLFPATSFASSTSTSLSQTSLHPGDSFTWTMSGTRDCSACVVNDNGGGASCSGNWSFNGNTRSGDYNWFWSTTCTAGSPGNYTFSSGKKSSNNNPCNGGWVSQCTSSQGYTVLQNTPGAFSLSYSTACTGAAPHTSLVWTSSANASYYDIYRNGGYLTSTSGTAYTDSGILTSTNYYYFAVARNSSGSYQSNYVGWFTSPSCDTTPPNVSISAFPPPGKTCLTPTDLATYPATATATDPGTNASGVRSVSILVNDATTNTTSSALAAIRNAATGLWGADIRSASPSLISGHVYTVSAQATDNAGNVSAVSAPSSKFDYDANQCVNPFLQTTGGDVHSNGGINTPGGP